MPIAETLVLHAAKNDTFTVAGAEPKRCPGRYLAGASMLRAAGRSCARGMAVAGVAAPPVLGPRFVLVPQHRRCGAVIARGNAPGRCAGKTWHKP